MTTIQNEYLKVTINAKGAQLSSLFNKATQTEHMWQAHSIWPWHAPNLFPVVGGLIGNQLHIDGNTYALPRHGFARQATFELLEATNQHAVFSLAASEHTMAVYPYQFAFQVLYDLFDNALRISYKVINLDNKAIWFSVGGHPAFNVPFGSNDTYEDYYLEFDNDQHLVTHLLSASGYFTGATRSLTLHNSTLPLTRSLFNDDALVFKSLKSRQVTIKSRKHAHSLWVEFPNFKQLGIWAKPSADFVCIEPWLGYADTENQVTDIENKEAMQRLEHGHVFEASYFIGVS